MFSLKNHPFAVETFFETSLVLAYAVAKEELTPLLPVCLELDTFDDRYGFIAAALVDTRDLRPKGFPVFMGNDFILAGFRIFVRYTDKRGKRLRGLYILGSETNKKKMSFFGNIFTHYNYQTTDIHFERTGELIQVSSVKSDIDIAVETDNENPSLPSGSPFADWKEARRFAGPLPFTFTFNEKKSEVLIIEGVRENWTPRPVTVLRHHIGFIEQKKFKNIVLANAFVVEQIPYHWKKGRKEIWKG